MNIRKQNNGDSSISLGDWLFVFCVACFAILAVHGSTIISAGGAIIDSDLATYAQGMAGSAHPESFLKDPVLHSNTAANSIANLERWLAECLTPEDNYAVGLLRAGGVIIFIFYLSWYILGRWLFRQRVYGLLLAVLVSITVWVGYGTFWGINHSDPVPRVFHAALFPWMLMLAISAYEKCSLRIGAMFVAGLGIWLHGVSALNTGAMFFVAFCLHKPKDASFSQYFNSLFLATLAFLVPVLIFLWPSLTQGKAFTASELSIFQELFTLRWHADYGDISGTLVALFSLKNPTSYILYAGCGALIFCILTDNPKLRTLGRMIPGFILGLFVVVGFSLLESHYAAQVGRLPMGHELVRGIKFLVPLAWLCICGVLAFFLAHLSKGIIWAIVLAIIVLVLGVSQDKQYLSAQYTLGELTEVKFPLLAKARVMKQEADLAREALEKVQELVPMGESVFCLTDSMMAIRYLALHPLFYSFKDGYTFYYNKDADGAHTWLTQTKFITKHHGELQELLQHLPVRYALAHKDTVREHNPFFVRHMIWQNSEWCLLSKEM